MTFKHEGVKINLSRENYLLPVLPCFLKYRCQAGVPIPRSLIHAELLSWTSKNTASEARGQVSLQISSRTLTQTIGARGSPWLKYFSCGRFTCEIIAIVKSFTFLLQGRCLTVDVRRVFFEAFASLEAWLWDVPRHTEPKTWGYLCILASIKMGRAFT